MSLNVMVVDDEPLARNSITTLLAQDADFNLVAEADSVKDALQILQEKQLDLVFLDIRLPDGNGFEIADSCRGQVPLVVFVTAYDQFALKAFEEQGLDYILKPFSRERFFRSLNRAKEQFRLLTTEEKPAPVEAEPEAETEHLMVKDRDRIFFIEPANIEYIEGANYYSLIHTAGKSFMLRESLQSLEERLMRFRFRRVHRSFLINIHCMDYLQKDERGNYQVVLKNKKVLPMGPKYQENLIGRKN